MALLDVNFFSYTLGMDTTMKVILPEKRGAKPENNQGKKYPVLYLLHGHGDDQTAWIRKSMVELAVRDRELIVVMPSTARGFYSNGIHGHKYFDFFTKELPMVVGNFFPASQRREDTYVAGLSMGGYGALKFALTCPEEYAGAASLSGGLYPMETLEAGKKLFSVPDFVENIVNYVGTAEQFRGSEDDLEYLARKLQDIPAEKLPRIYQSCGRQDGLYASNVCFRDVLQQTLPELSYQWNEKDGDHNWDFWNSEIESILSYLGL